MSKTGNAQRNSSTAGSAAATFGCVGLPEPGYYQRGQGTLREFCSEFNQRFEQKADAGNRPEWRHFAEVEREMRAT